MANGLSSQSVNQITRDQKGFVWIATKNGLNRFDGEEFRLYESEDTGVLTDNIAGILTDATGMIWVFCRDADATSGALDTVQIFNPNIEAIASYEKAVGVYPKSGFNAMVNWISTNQGVIIGTNEHYLHWIHPDGKTVSAKDDTRDYHVPITWSEKHGVYTLQKELGKGDENALAYRITEADTIVTPNAGIGHKLNKGCVGFDLNGNLRFFNQDGKFHPHQLGSIFRYTSEGMIPEPMEVEDLLATSMYDFSAIHFQNNPYTDDTWLFYKDSLIILDQNFNVRYQSSFGKDPQLSGNIQSIYFEDADHVWVATMRGFYQVEVQKKRFKQTFSYSQTGVTKGASNSCRAIQELNDGRVLLTTDNGTTIIETEGAKSSTSHRYVTPTNYVSLGFEYEGDSFLYTDSGRVARYFLNQDKVEFLSGRITDIGEESWSIRTLSNGDILVGGDRLTHWNTSTGDVSYSTLCDDTTQLNRNVYQILEHKSQVWIATQIGLVNYDVQSRTCTKYSSSDSGAQYIPAQHIHALFIDDEGIFWLAAADNGLIKWNKNDGSITRYGRQQGLADDVVYGILEDAKGYLWLSTANGLCRFDPETETSVNYGTEHGLSELEFNRNSFHKGASGTFYFGTVNGYYSFNPSDFWEDEIENDIPLQVIALSQDVSAENKVVNMYRSFLENPSVLLAPFDRFFTVEFKLLEQKDRKALYAYRIDGVDDDWNYIRQNSIRISGLNGGKFTLRVMGQLANGSWSSNILSIPITVIEPVYKRPWFITLMLMLLVVLIMAFLRSRTAVLRSQKAKLENEVSERTAELDVSLKQKEVLLKEIHHRVKNNLQIISSFIELETLGVKDEKTKQILKQGRNRVKAMALIHKNLYQKDDLGNIDMQTYTEELLGAIMSGFGADARKVNLSISMNKIMLDIDTAIPLGLCLTELVTNAFKYAFADTDKGEIRIALSGVDAGYLLVLKDNGPGFPEGFKKRSGSLGLNLVNMLTEQMDGNVDFSNENGARIDINFKGIQTRKLED